MQTEERPFFATAAKGTEGALRDELRELRLPRVRADRGGVHFGGELEHGMRACLRSRIAQRVLYRLHAFEAPDGDALYAGVREVDWSPYLDASRTLSVSASVRHGALRHSGFVAQRIKDGIVDQLRQRQGQRPDVQRHDPDVHVMARIVRDHAELYLDLAGQPLHRRGYRTQSGEAPLKETLAAAVLRLAGWAPGTPLWDPMCGSGTFCIEAVSWALGQPAGEKRTFGFERWLNHDADARAQWQREHERAQRFARPVASAVRGSDRDPEAIRAARQNAERAGVEPHLEVGDLFHMGPPKPGTFVVCNPPYGVRLSQSRAMLAQLGRAISGMRGCRVAVLTPERELVRAVARRPALERSLHNGDLECRLFCWEIP